MIKIRGPGAKTAVGTITEIYVYLMEKKKLIIPLPVEPKKGEIIIDVGFSGRHGPDFLKYDSKSGKVYIVEVKGRRERVSLEELEKEVRNEYKNLKGEVCIELRLLRKDVKLKVLTSTGLEEIARGYVYEVVKGQEFLKQKYILRECKMQRK